MQCGIKVVLWDFGVVLVGCQIYFNFLNNVLIGEINVKFVVDVLQVLNVEKGEVVVLSVILIFMNQNIWIEEMKKVLLQYLLVQLVIVVYGDDLLDKSYCEVVGLLKLYLDLKVIVLLLLVGIVVVVQVVKDQGKIGKVYVIGLGLLLEMVGVIKFGVSKSFVIWNLIDLGYVVIYLVDDLVKGMVIKIEVSMGKLGKVKLDVEGNGVMVKLFVYDVSNIDKFLKIF